MSESTMEDRQVREIAENILAYQVTDFAINTFRDREAAATCIIQAFRCPRKVADRVIDRMYP